MDFARTGSIAQDALRLGFQATCTAGISTLLKINDITVEACESFKERHISDVEKHIENFVTDITGFEKYQADYKTKSAVERQLAIIGEAINQIRKENTEIVIESAVQIVVLRNRLIHSYDSTEDTVIWAIIVKHIPNLKKEIELLMTN